MTTGAWAYIGIGFFVGLATAVMSERNVRDPLPPGLMWLWGWMAWPLIVGGFAVAGVIMGLGKVASAVERKTPRRASREELQARVAARDRRIAELEAANGIGQDLEAA